jgi:hypothetical protein
MIVHFVTDEKIIDQIIENFLEISKENLFLVFVEEESSVFKNITIEGQFLKRFFYKEENINQVLSSQNVNAIIVHSLRDSFAQTINSLEFEVNIAWIEWGFDIYALPKIYPSLFAPKTRKFLLKIKPRRKLYWIIMKYDALRKLYYLVKRTNDPIQVNLEAMRKIKFFCTYIKEDFEYFSQFYHLNNLQYFELSFSTIDQYLAGNKNSRIKSNANNILVGNSSSITSNYLDVIEILSKNRKDYKKAYFILSYGDSEEYKGEVIGYGKKIIKDQFEPVTKFMQRHDYIELLQKCSIGIFFHYRQQAMGNIIAMLYMGARVYLSEKNPAYFFFLRKNIIVNSFENDFEKFMTNKLSKEERENNRINLELLFNKGKVINDLRVLSQTLINYQYLK